MNADPRKLSDPESAELSLEEKLAIARAPFAAFMASDYDGSADECESEHAETGENK